MQCQCASANPAEWDYGKVSQLGSCCTGNETAPEAAQENGDEENPLKTICPAMEKGWSECNEALYESSKVVTDLLIDGSGEITIGRVGPVSSAATASDEDQCLAVLVRRPEESFEDLLTRLDRAIADAVEDQIFVDEING